VDFG
jgi:tetratricopeptide (TPR) repeat protein